MDLEDRHPLGGRTGARRDGAAAITAGPAGCEKRGGSLLEDVKDVKEDDDRDRNADRP
jgi:hypothetical protein